MKAWIKGLGWVTPAGCGQGRKCQSHPLQKGVLEIPSRKQIFSQIDRRFGRLDDFSRVGLAAVTFCLRDAGVESWQQKRPVGILAVSRYGCLQTDLNYHQTLIPEQGKLASPNLFAYTLPNCFLGEAALRFGLTGNSMIINHHDSTHLTAFMLGLEELSWSQQTGLLTGIVDLAPPSELAADNDFAGGFFVLLEKDQFSGSGDYGELAMHDHKLFLDDQPLDDLSHLISACLQK